MAGALLSAVDIAQRCDVDASTARRWLRLAYKRHGEPVVVNVGRGGRIALRTTEGALAQILPSLDAAASVVTVRALSSRVADLEKRIDGLVEEKRVTREEMRRLSHEWFAFSERFKKKDGT